MEPSIFDSVLCAARTGAEWAWERLYRELSGPLVGYARARGAVEPDDVVGEVFLELARGVSTFEGGWPAFKGWAFLIASHRVIDEHRRASRRREEPRGEIPETITADVTADAADEAAATDTALRLLAQLSASQREVLLLRIFADLPIEEVARVTGRSITGVKALQRRGLAALRRNLSVEAVSR